MAALLVVFGWFCGIVTVIVGISVHDMIVFRAARPPVPKLPRAHIRRLRRQRADLSAALARRSR